jgi:hypothetical protein
MWDGTMDEAPVTVVLVEGESDRLAVEALAVRLGHDLAAAGAVIVSMHGVTNLRRHLADLAAMPVRPRVIGLFDAGEVAYVLAVVEEAGLGRTRSVAELAELGYFACEPDLEGELIRALGVDRVQQLFAEHGELARFRTFQHQPYQRARPVEAQLRRFMGTHGGRKARFAPIFVAALDEARIPAALTALVSSAAGQAASRN